MDIDDKSRVRKLRHYLGLIGWRVTRESVPPKELYVLEPAGPWHEPPPDDAAWAPFNVGDAWGGKQQWTAFRAALCVPDAWAGRPVELRMRHHVRWLEPPVDDNFPAGPEGQVFIDGLRAGAIDGAHHSIRAAFEPGHCYDVRAVFFAGRAACRHSLEVLELALVDAGAERLYHDLRVALDLVEATPPGAPARSKLLEAVEAAVRTVEQGDLMDAGFYEHVHDAHMAFNDGLAEIAGDGDAPEVVCFGHAHIDLAWLWPFEQSRHKCTRTFATQCRLLEQYGGWSFLQSQAQAYAWVEQHAPDLFERIRALARAGRWEVEGATWVEMDTNVTGGESLVRQFLYGKRYFRQKFGVDCKVLWLPDVFGYSAALPQLMKLAGVEGFVTSKMSWNAVNRFPYDTFRWRGLDGTDLPTLFITTPCREWYYTYNAGMTVQELKGTWDEYRQKDAGTEPLMSFGHGDGGGGPTETMLETAERLARGLALPGIPRARLDKVGALMGRIARRAGRLPVWDGELYLEFHRGTYTTQGWLKRANRKNEVALHNVEWLASLAGPHGFRLDRAGLDAMWEDLLLCQFHDVLPGSSVGEVYEDVRAMQKEIAHQAEATIAGAADTLARQVDTAEMGDPVVVLNTLSWDRRGPVQMPDGSWRDDVTVPAGGWTAVDCATRPERAPDGGLSVSADGCHLSSRFYDLRLDGEGRIARLYDRANAREVLPRGTVANQWQIFADRPTGGDAWNVPSYYEDFPLPGPMLVGVKVVEQCDARAAVELMWDLPNEGSITQRIALYAESPRIDFETVVEWHTHHQLLKVAFPVDVRAADAAYQVQFGHVRRPTHHNTPWDVARYEGCAHGFVDLSEHGYGVALLNDCKYGYDVRENVMRLTCLKSPRSPHGEADQGTHTFTYALLPHAGTFQEAGVIRAAAELNVPPIVRSVQPTDGQLPATFSFVQVEGEAVVVETLKPAEDGDGLIMRLYESHGSHAPTVLTFAEAPASVATVNLLEEPREEDVGLKQDGARVTLRLRPFQIVSLRVKPKP